MLVRISNLGQYGLQVFIFVFCYTAYNWLNLRDSNVAPLQKLCLKLTIEALEQKQAHLDCVFPKRFNMTLTWTVVVFALSRFTTESWGLPQKGLTVRLEHHSLMAKTDNK